MIKGNVSYRGALKYLQNVAKQERFATVNALTRTAMDVKDDETAALSRYLKSPTPFTKRAYRWQRATKAKPVSAVYAAPIQETYLHAQVFGDVNKGHVPGRQQKLNQYGNLPKGAVKRKNTFQATIKGIFGTWQRVGKGKNRRIVLIAHYPKSRHYKKRLPFFEVAERGVARKFKSNYATAFRKAMASAR